MSNLNLDQQKAVNSHEGAIALISGPGSGKTAVLVARYKSIVESGISPNDILSLTFTKSAADEMQRRAGKGNFRTFHSFGYDVISREKGRPPMEPELRHRLLIKLIRKYRLDYKELTAYISAKRHQNISTEQAIAEDPYGKPQAYREYEKERAAGGWIDFECQPPETLVTVVVRKPTMSHPILTEQRPISSLKEGDTLLTWERRRMFLKTYGRRLNGVTSRQYRGPLLTIHCPLRKTQATPNHWFWARFNSNAVDKYAIYLMYRQDLGFRVGQCKFLSGGYSNWKTRLVHQKAERMWVLEITDNYYEALTREAEISVKWGIPQTVFENIRNYPNPEAIRRIFQAADPMRGFQCLEDFGRVFEFPLVSSGKMVQWIRQTSKKGKCLGGYQKFAACNLIPEIMSLPGYTPTSEQPIVNVTREQYDGRVYSLDVDVDHTYIADGIPVGNSMIRDAVDLLELPSIRTNHQYRYVMADECQDTDDLQFRLLQLITERHGNIMCVGDPGQSIYMFRGAQPENLTNFTHWFPKGRYLYLGQNYRSTRSIVDFVRENYPIQTPLKEKLLPARCEEGSAIDFRFFYSEADEAESAVVAAQEDSLNSIILARTNRGLALAENLCIEHNIRYHLLGKSGFWKQTEILKTVDKLKEYGHVKPEIAFNIVMPDLERHYQAEDATPEDNFALENIRTLREISKKFADTKTFCVFANKAAHAKRTTKGITLSTVHQAKGTEFSNVFFIGARAGMVPHDKGDFSEERRIAFVAISRAKDRLRISWTGQPSSFWRRYLPEPVMDELREKASQVERIEKQLTLLG